ncbi:WxL domain-containing protein [Erysipelothrix urinaevulpis]|uniref:WxL domain-containing protein n=1 Tax=Erysipelothrix urinaevulpis TaxID=2683717 RepID=UPI001357B31F|nr:WxL domain-containing protein [Erysipelothrix urinaevulpis]
MTRKKAMKLFSSMILGAFMFIGATSINAEEQVPKVETSTANIKFAVDTETVDPVNPVDPTDPTDPGDIDNGTGDGPLAIVAYPQAMDFGSQKVGKGIQTYEADLKKPNIQIQDKRGAASDGWNLSVGLSDFENSTATADGKLVKGKITFDNTELFHGNETETQQPSNVSKKFVVESGKTVQFASAAKGEGLGHWGFHWYAPNYKTNETNSNVKLEMDTNQVVAGSYTANLEWTLSATPNQ